MRSLRLQVALGAKLLSHLYQELSHFKLLLFTENVPLGLWFKATYVYGLSKDIQCDELRVNRCLL